MNRLWLLLDGDNLCSRAHHTTGGLENGTMFGFFRALAVLQERFGTEDVAVCFDEGRSLRSTHDKRYKAERIAKRKAMTPEERTVYRGFRQQKDDLRELHLPRLGYRNVHAAEGYEADDLLAALARQIEHGDEAVIVSSDKDLFQCIRGQVRCHNPITLVTTDLQTFKQKYGVMPAMWPDVKALAGCVSDEIVGIPGVGEKRACKFLLNEFPVGSKWHELIAHNTGVWQFNLELTRLPYPGCPAPALTDNELTAERWIELMDELDMPVLKAAAPRRRRPKLTAASRYSNKR